jgi:hypothetical protein
VWGEGERDWAGRKSFITGSDLSVLCLGERKRQGVSCRFNQIKRQIEY